MKKHVVVGGETLEMARDKIGRGTFMDMASDIARYHHERFDGSGYCAGLQEQDIPSRHESSHWPTCMML